MDKLWKKQRRRELIYLRRSELGKRMFGKSQKKYLRKVHLGTGFVGAEPLFCVVYCRPKTVSPRTLLLRPKYEGFGLFSLGNMTTLDTTQS